MSSVLGFGAPLPNGDIFSVILFSKKVIPEATRNAFLGKAEPISADMSTLLSTL